MQGPARRSAHVLGASEASPAFVIALALGAALALAGSAALALAGRNERGEWLLFVFTYGGALPISLLAAWRLARAGRATWLRAAAAAGGLGVLLLLARLSHAVEPASKGSAAVVMFAGLGMAAAIALLGGSAARSAAPPTGRLFPALAALALAALMLAFVPGSLLGAGDVTLAAVAGVGAGVLFVRARPVSLTRRAALALDLLLSALVVLLVVDVVGYTADGPSLSDGVGLTADTVRPAVQLHLDYYLGPVNDVLHGRALLVESAGQYGVSSLYLVAAWLKAAPLGYGPLGFLAAVLAAGQYLAAYWIQRVAGCGPVIAGAASLAAVAITVLAAFGSPAFFPSTGALRFGLPFVLVLVVLLSARRSASRTPASIPALVVVALSAVWSIETFVYVLAAYVAMAAFDAATRADSPRYAGRLLGGQLARAAMAVAAAHVVFAIATRLLAGDWPDWAWYVDYFRTYSTGGLSQALAPAWTPAWVIGATYFASLAGLVAVVATSRVLALEKRVPLLAVAGISAIGATFMTYFVGRSLDLLLPFVALPAFVLGAIWLSLALERERVPRRIKAAALGLATWVAVLGVALAWPGASDRWPRTALAHLPPGGRSLGDSLGRVWDSPPMDPRSRTGERLIREHFGGSDRVLVIAEPDVAAEVVFRARRANVLPISIGWQDDLLFERSARDARRAVAKLRAGTPMLLQRSAVTRLNDPPASGVVSVIGTKRLSAVQLAGLRAIRARFDLETVVRGRDGFEVVRLREKRRG